MALTPPEEGLRRSQQPQLMLRTYSCRSPQARGSMASSGSRSTPFLLLPPRAVADAWRTRPRPYFCWSRAACPPEAACLLLPASCCPLLPAACCLLPVLG